MNEYQMMSTKKKQSDNESARNPWNLKDVLFKTRVFLINNWTANSTKKLNKSDKTKALNYSVI